MVLTVTLCLLTIVLVYVGYPLLHPPSGTIIPAKPESQQRQHLLAEYESALTLLKDLDFEWSIGNISKQDYAEQRGPYRHKAVAILRALDHLHDEEGGPLSLEAQLEAEIAQARERLTEE